MDLDEEIKSRGEGEIGSESREKGDLLPCSSPPLLSRVHGLLSHGYKVESRGTEKVSIVSLELVPIHVNSRLRVRNLC